jgi:hypothetical protein
VGRAACTGEALARTHEESQPIASQRMGRDAYTGEALAHTHEASQLIASHCMGRAAYTGEALAHTHVASQPMVCIPMNGYIGLPTLARRWPKPMKRPN